MGMFRWRQRSSAESEKRGSRSDPARTASSATESNPARIDAGSRVQDFERHDQSPGDDDAQHDSTGATTHNEGGESVGSGGDGEARAEANGVAETEGDGPSAAGMLRHFRGMLDQIKRITFGPEEERAMVGVLFESVKEVHEAGRRHISR